MWRRVFWLSMNVSGKIPPLYPALITGTWRWIKRDPPKRRYVSSSTTRRHNPEYGNLEQLPLNSIKCYTVWWIMNLKARRKTRSWCDIKYYSKFARGLRKTKKIPSWYSVCWWSSEPRNLPNLKQRCLRRKSHTRQDTWHVHLVVTLAA